MRCPWHSLAQLANADKMIALLFLVVLDNESKGSWNPKKKQDMRRDWRLAVSLVRSP